jgi:hypothetical protein
LFPKPTVHLWQSVFSLLVVGESPVLPQMPLTSLQMEPPQLEDLLARDPYLKPYEKHISARYVARDSLFLVENLFH